MKLAPCSPQTFSARRFLPLLLLLAAGAIAAPPQRCVAEESAEPVDLTAAAAVASQIDELLQAHWQASGVTPAAVCDDATFLRRVTLDLAGRIPTAEELATLAADAGPQRRQQAIGRLLQAPEFAIHFADVLDHVIQDTSAGNKDFVAYLRRSMETGRTWDTMFRDMLVGPWEDEQDQQANRFLDRRARDLDRMTADTARVFFGVDITCARCHDHPLVADWSQDHYYGMAAFFGRTQGGKGKISEKKEGEVTFQGSGSEQKTARMMFLTGELIAEDTSPSGDGKKAGANTTRPTSGLTRRDRLVEAGLRDQRFFARSMVNRVWDFLFGRGLVEPVDQMHSENPAAVPAVLDYLGTDFAEHGYDLRRLVAAIALSDAYQRDSRWTGPGEPPAETHFAVGPIRPLTPRQYAVSLLLLANPLAAEETPKERSARFADLHRQAAEVEGAFDPRAAGFESSTAEALYLANSPAVRKLLSPAEGGLAQRLAEIEENQALATSAVEALYGRPAQPTERRQLAAWLKRQPGERRDAVERLVWALATSAEFRFNH